MATTTRARLLAGSALLLGVSTAIVTGPPAAAASSVPVRAGRHDGFDRLVINWPNPVQPQIHQDGDLLRVALAGDGKLDVASVSGRLGGHILGVAQGHDSEGAVLLVRMAPERQHRLSMLSDHRVVLDVGAEPPAPRPRQTLAALAPAKAAIEPAVSVQQELYRRDLMIASLLRRIERLERGTSLPEEPDEDAAALTTVAEPRIASTDMAAPATAAPPAMNKPAPLPAERALERTLVREGTLLLRPGELELEPGFSFTHRESDAPVFVTDGGSASIFVGENKVRRNEYLGSLELRAGLPFDSQVELSLPYRVVDQSAVTDVGFDEADEADGTGRGLGDLQIAAAKTLLRQKGWQPDLVARTWWDTASGETEDDHVALGAGFHELGASLSALRRQDPLAFFATLSYETSLERDDFDPGDEVGLSLGSALAVTPDTSLRFGFDQRFVNDAEFNGHTINGSDQTIGTLSLEVGTVLTRRVLLNLGVDVGVTEDAPDYTATISLPVRFNLPIL